MKRTATHPPVVPKGYTGRDFNNWQRYLQGEISLVYMDRKQMKVLEQLVK